MLHRSSTEADEFEKRILGEPRDPLLFILVYF
jgi:hypothetical protein